MPRGRHLPGMTGVALARRLTQMGLPHPVIVIAVTSLSELVRIALSGGLDISHR